MSRIRIDSPAFRIWDAVAAVWRQPIVKVGQATIAFGAGAAAGSVAIVFAPAYPTAILGAWANHNSFEAGIVMACECLTQTVNGFTLTAGTLWAALATGNHTFDWLAIGF